MKNILLSTVAGLSTVLLASCGSSAGSGNCGKVAPCGGNIVGDWTIVDTCLAFTGSDASPLGAACPSATLDAGGFNATGTVSYRSDLTFSTMITLSGTMGLSVPQSCLTMEGITLTCAQLDQALKLQFAQNPDPSIQSVSCTGSAGCRCTFALTPQTSSGVGTYAVSGNNVIENGGDPTGFCVQGSELHVSETNMDMGGLGVSGGFVLEK